MDIPPHPQCQKWRALTTKSDGRSNRHTASEIVSTSNWKYISCRKFRAGNQYEFLSQTVEEAILSRMYCRYNVDPDETDCVKCKCRTWFSPVQCRIALRRSASYGGHPSPAPLHSACFCKQKKSTDSNPYGLPSVALAKDGQIEYLLYLMNFANWCLGWIIKNWTARFLIRWNSGCILQINNTVQKILRLDLFLIVKCKKNWKTKKQRT